MRLVIILVSIFIVLQAKDVHPPIGDFAPKCLAGNGSLYDPTKSAEVIFLVFRKNNYVQGVSKKIGIGRFFHVF